MLRMGATGACESGGGCRLGVWGLLKKEVRGDGI